MQMQLVYNRRLSKPAKERMDQGRKTGPVSSKREEGWKEPTRTVLHSTRNTTSLLRKTSSCGPRSRYICLAGECQCPVNALTDYCRRECIYALKRKTSIGGIVQPRTNHPRKTIVSSDPMAGKQMVLIKPFMKRTFLSNIDLIRNKDFEHGYRLS